MWRSTSTYFCGRNSDRRSSPIICPMSFALKKATIAAAWIRLRLSGRGKRFRWVRCELVPRDEPVPLSAPSLAEIVRDGEEGNLPKYLISVVGPTELESVTSTVSR